MSEEYKNQHIVDVDIEKELKSSYIEYAMSVIVGRALPDVRDGLKPVHRRILYTMYEDGFTPDKNHRKCATTVGSVLGRYHPHGDAAVYDALVRLAQDFSLRYPLIDGHGNFGSIDGDPPAAYRYTEARLSKISLEMLKDIEKETVSFTPNFDDTRKEPTVLPSRIPNLLVNGSSGIAVGMATNIPPHNLGEVIDGICALIDDPNITIDELMNYIKGPDFPTYGIILGKSGIRAAYHTGRGKIILRAKAEIETMENGRQRIVITQIPYQVNKTRLIEKIAELVRDKRIDGITHLLDESSNRTGLRIVIEVRRDANANVILNQLYKFTQLQESFSVIMLALVNNEPKILNLREVLDNYLNFQKEVVVNRAKYDLKKAQDRAHILEGLRIALQNIDEVIKIIRESYDNAKERLIERFELTEIQAQAILDMRLARLQGLEIEKIEEEYQDLLEKIKYYTRIINEESLVLSIIKEELLEVKNKYNDERRTVIENLTDDIDIEDLIEEEESIYTLTHFGYIKRMPASAYKTQHRGGKGIVGIQTREEDFVECIFSASTHANILFFTNKGKVYRLKGYQIPEAGRQAKGTFIANILALDGDEKIQAVIPVDKFEEGKYLLMATKNGVIKKTDLLEYDTQRKGGLIAITLDDGDELINVNLTDGTKDVIIGTYQGMAIRFSENDVRPLGRVTRGVKAITLREGDWVVSMSVPESDSNIRAVTELGFGKKTPVSEYKVQNRGGIGVTTYKISGETGNVIALTSVSDKDDIMLITSEGTIIRLDSAEISTIGRSTKGVRLMKLDEGVKVVSVARVSKEE